MTVPSPTSPDCYVDGCERPAKYRRKRLCNRHYLRLWKYGSTDLPGRPTLVERLAAATELSADCWIWTGSVGDHGYGHIGSVYVHRLAFEISHRPLAHGEYVLHSCDVRRCVNPDHLSAGSHLDNIADARQKGRMRNSPVDGRFLPLGVS